MADVKSLKFTQTHEWIEPEGARRKVGITEFAQDQLGEVVYVELGEEGQQVQAGAEVGVIESCKATSPIYAPLPGKIVAFNERLADEPNLLNEQPYGDGWVYELELDDNADESQLMEHDAYANYQEQADH